MIMGHEHPAMERLMRKQAEQWQREQTILERMPGSAEAQRIREQRAQARALGERLSGAGRKPGPAGTVTYKLHPSQPGDAHPYVHQNKRRQIQQRR